jgi:hypothetical protein
MSQPVPVCRQPRLFEQVSPRIDVFVDPVSHYGELYSEEPLAAKGGLRALVGAEILVYPGNSSSCPFHGGEDRDRSLGQLILHSEAICFSRSRR